ncbi:MAG: S1 RNA-binding domain-containing protein, partial [Gammaproteobacteria bacterium]|nr:S1 RNA-binding domain-containing protein [Gammaproteobacteria bacterium]
PAADSTEGDATDAADSGEQNESPAEARLGIDVEEVEDFGKALEDFESGAKTIKEGEVVTGRVLKVLEKEVIVDIGYKSEGVIDIEEFRAVDRSINVSTG